MLTGRKILLYLSIKYKGNWDEIYEAIKKKENIDREEVEVVVNNINCQYVTIVDENYPESLKHIYKPPFVLFYHGDFNLCSDYNKILSVVGSRQCSDYAIQMTNNIISHLNNQFVIASGLAIGIDAVAHQSIIRSQGKTIAVLGCGINYIYPRSNQELYEIIKKDHLLISEYPDQEPPKSDNFPIRNRIITGLAWGLLVPEVKAKSGTLISVAHAINQGKEVLVLPQEAQNGTYNNQLIRDGATLVETGQDVLNEKK